MSNYRHDEIPKLFGKRFIRSIERNGENFTLVIEPERAKNDIINRMSGRISANIPTFSSEYSKVMATNILTTLTVMLVASVTTGNQRYAELSNSSISKEVGRLIESVRTLNSCGFCGGIKLGILL